ncbi:MAG: tellurite resistance/C4-dicarboxylate transporter family protein [Candidatus Dormibacteraceae bacterium]
MGAGERFQSKLVADVGDFEPGHFALVMATGILSTAALSLGPIWLSRALLVVACVAFVGLCVLAAWRLVGWPRRMLADATTPGRAFTLLAFVAGSNVLASRLVQAGLTPIAEVLAAVGTVGWVVLTYLIPARLIAAEPKAPFASAFNGTWLIWVVATQSVTETLATVATQHPGQQDGLVFASVVLWGLGVFLYLVLMATMVPRLLVAEDTPDHLTHPYWITMGATAISVLAAARILALHVQLSASLPPTVLTGIALMLWAFGSWWIPLLAVLEFWRHVLQRTPLRYEPSLWDVVFPLGMYAAASEAFGQVTGIPILVSIAHVEVWFAVVAWVATFAGMLVTAWLLFRRDVMQRE